MTRLSWRVTADKCFHCGNLKDTEHREDCPHRLRTVVIKLEIQLVTKAAEFQDAENIEYMWQEHTDPETVLEDLQRILVDQGSFDLSVKFLREASAEDQEYHQVFI